VEIDAGAEKGHGRKVGTGSGEKIRNQKSEIRRKRKGNPEILSRIGWRGFIRLGIPYEPDGKYDGKAGQNQDRGVLDVSDQGSELVNSRKGKLG
jgi:hypothetical protein